jgi:hypothetical protein
MEKLKLVVAAGLWKKESGPAGVFFTGKMGKLPDGMEIKEGAKLFIFKNKKPKQANSPTHILNVEDTRPDGSGGDPGERESERPSGFEGFSTPEEKAPW